MVAEIEHKLLLQRHLSVHNLRHELQSLLPLATWGDRGKALGRSGLCTRKMADFPFQIGAENKRRLQLLVSPFYLKTLLPFSFLPIR